MGGFSQSSRRSRFLYVQSHLLEIFNINQLGWEKAEKEKMQISQFLFGASEEKHHEGRHHCLPYCCRQCLRTCQTSLAAFENKLGVQPPLGFFDPFGMLSTDATQERLERL